MISFDEIYRQIGGFGRFQYIIFFLLSILTFKTAFEFQSLIISIYYDQKFKCDLSNISNTNSSKIIVSDDQCNYKFNNSSTKWIKCDKFIYDRTIFQHSLITDFDLVCDRYFYRDLLVSLKFALSSLSLPIIILADKFGRKNVLFISLFIYSLIKIWQILLQTTVELFVTGLSLVILQSVYIGLSFTTLVEFIPIDNIEITASSYWFFYSIGYMSVAVIAYFSRNWRYIYGFPLIISIVYFFYPYYIKDTPRWLMLRNEKEKACEVLELVAKTNNKKLERSNFDQLKLTNQPTGQFWALFKSKLRILRMAVFVFTAGTFSFAYVGVSTDLNFASNNIFLTTFIMGIVDAPTAPCGGICAKRFGRKRSICFLCGLGIVCLTFLPFLNGDLTKSNWQPWIKMLLAFGGKFGFTSAWCVFDVFLSELLPTSERNIGISIVYTIISLTSSMSPILNKQFLAIHFALPCLFYSGLLVCTVLLVHFILPETKGIPLPQTMDQAISLQRGKEKEYKQSIKDNEINDRFELEILTTANENQ